VTSRGSLISERVHDLLVGRVVLGHPVLVFASVDPVHDNRGRHTAARQNRASKRDLRSSITVLPSGRGRLRSGGKNRTGRPWSRCIGGTTGAVISGSLFQARGVDAFYFLLLPVILLGITLAM
jgi:hypothetical protein